MADDQKPEDGEEKKMDGKMDKDKMMYHYHGRKGFGILFGILILIIFVGLGVAIGRMASWRNVGFNRERNVVINEGGRGGMMDRGFGQRIGRGVTGDVTKIDGNNITINNGSTDTTVAVQDSTSIVTLNGTVAKLADIKLNNSITVSGTSNSSGTITATAIRIN